MNTKRGFTLIELLVVISIIAVLSSVVFASLSSARAKSQDAQVKLQVRQAINALYLARNDSTGDFPGGTYPGHPYCLKTSGSCWLGTYVGDSSLSVLNSYISVIPIPPNPPFTTGIAPPAATYLGGGYLYYPNITAALPFGAGTFPGTYLVWAQSVPITNCKGQYIGSGGDGYYYCNQNITLYP
jgi:prepilin-type N-terminal cleavage/methylation domain-containing protein